MHNQDFRPYNHVNNFPMLWNFNIVVLILDCRSSVHVSTKIFLRALWSDLCNSCKLSLVEYLKRPLLWLLYCFPFLQFRTKCGVYFSILTITGLPVWYWSLVGYLLYVRGISVQKWVQKRFWSFDDSRYFHIQDEVWQLKEMLPKISKVYLSVGDLAIHFHIFH